MFSPLRIRAVSVAYAFVLAGVMSNAAWAVLIVNDTWQDSTRHDPQAPAYAENDGKFGQDADHDGDIESVWYRSGTGATGSVSPGHMINNPASGSSMSLTTYIAREAQPVTLVNVGDKISVHWVFTPTGVTTTSTSNSDMRIALVDSPSASRVTSDATPGSAAYTGYGVFFNMRSPTLGTSNAFRIMERNFTTTPGDLTDALLSSSGAYTARANVGANGAPGYTSGVTYTFDLSVTKTAAGADIAASMAGTGLNTTGTLSTSFSDTTPQPLVFDTFALRPQTGTLSALSFDTSLFQVDFFTTNSLLTVPENSSFVLVGMVGIGWFAARRLHWRRWFSA